MFSVTLWYHSSLSYIALPRGGGTNSGVGETETAATEKKQNVTSKISMSGLSGAEVGRGGMKVCLVSYTSIAMYIEIG